MGANYLERIVIAGARLGAPLHPAVGVPPRVPDLPRAPTALDPPLAPASKANPAPAPLAPSPLLERSRARPAPSVEPIDAAITNPSIVPPQAPAGDAANALPAAPIVPPASALA